MTQSKITKWFIDERPELYVQTEPILYKYFYIKWYNTLKPSKCVWTNVKPELYNISKKISLKNNTNIELYGYFSKSIKKEDAFIDLSEIAKKKDYIEYCNSSLLKSQIQKCVRRGEHCKAVRSSFHLMRLDFIAFCRRFPIICIEDSSMHLNLNVVYWFMMYGTTSILTKCHIRYILGLVVLVAKSKYTDGDYSDINTDKFNFRAEWINTSDIPDSNKRNILFGILTRISYGGMKGDMSLLKRTYLTFKTKFINNDIDQYLLEKHQSIKITRYLSLYDILPEAVDFHCYPKILEKLNKLHPEIDTAAIKKLIWNNSSSINIRYGNYNKYNENIMKDERWTKIKKDFYRIGKQFILNCN